jgi:hypothetical protein
MSVIQVSPAIQNKLLKGDVLWPLLFTSLYNMPLAMTL